MVRQRSATIRDVARLAGVAPSTASRVLSGKELQIPVTEKTRRRVLAAAQSLDYRRNRLATGLAVARTHLIGFSLPSITPDLHQAYPAVTYENRGATICGMLAVFQSRGYEMHILNRIENEASSPSSRRKPCVDFLDGII